MTIKLATTVRTALAQAIISAAGAGAKLRGYSGTEPSGMGAVAGGNTLLVEVAFGATIGTANAGTIDWDEAGATQTPANNVPGTPTFFDLTTSANVLVGRLGLGGAGAGEWSWTGTVAVGQPISLQSLVWTMPGGQA